MTDGDTFKDWWGCVSFVRRRKRMVSSPSRGWLVDRFKTRKRGEHLRREQDLAPAAVQESDTGLFKCVSLHCPEIPSSNTAHSTCLSSLAIYLLLLTLALSFLGLYSG